MRVFKGVTKANDRVIKTLTKSFGVESSIFFPKEFNNNLHGFKDNDIEYHEDVINRRVLIPALFRTQNRTLSILDPFHEDGERLLYVPTDIIYPQYTKIELSYPNNIHTFFITEVLEKKDEEERALSRKYVIVPDLTFNMDSGSDKLEGLSDTLEDELTSQEEVSKDFLDKTLVSPSTNNLSEETFVIKPIKAV